MAKKIAVLIDGGFLNKKIKTVPNPQLQASRIIKVAHACIDPAEEELYRIFYYDCGPFGLEVKDLVGNVVDFSKTKHFAYQKSLLAFIAKQPFVAVRLGMLSYRGWALKSHIVRELQKNPQAKKAFTFKDFVPDFQQKGVDMRIGLDVALLAMDGLVDRVVLITADSDFIPAMKLARREGLQVVLSSLASRTKRELLDHADIFRNPDLTGI